MTTAIRLLVGAAALALSACQAVNLDPDSHRDFAKASPAETMPPADLSGNGVLSP